MNRQNQQKQTGPSPATEQPEDEDIQEILDKAAKAIATLQQKVLVAERKSEIATLIKTMVKDHHTPRSS
jgi:hypothetical protein